jgi:hypothetical protein
MYKYKVKVDYYDEPDKNYTEYIYADCIEDVVAIMIEKFGEPLEIVED